MERHKMVMIGASSLIVVGLAMVVHECAHVVAGMLAGGTPTLLTATEVKGDFDSLSPAGFVSFGFSGTLINLLFCALGWWGLNRASASAEFRLAAWILFSVNGIIVGTETLFETVAGWGDWATILNPLPGTLMLRVVFAILGAAFLIFMVKRSAATLATLVQPGEPRQRVAEARRIVLIGAIAAAVLVVGGNIFNPVGSTRGVLLGLGAGVGPFALMMLGARFVGRFPSTEAPQPVKRVWPWLAAGIATTLVTWFVFGPGIHLT
jgi:hypothetical protein